MHTKRGLAVCILELTQIFFIGSLYAVYFVVPPKNFFGLYGGRRGWRGHRGQKFSKKKYASKCLELPNTVWSEGFLYKVAPPELNISPIMYFVMYNSIVQAKVPKIIVPIKQNFKNSIFTTYIKLIILIISDIDKQGQNFG